MSPWVQAQTRSKNCKSLWNQRTVAVRTAIACPCRKGGSRVGARRKGNPGDESPPPAPTFLEGDSADLTLRYAAVS